MSVSGNLDLGARTVEGKGRKGRKMMKTEDKLLEEMEKFAVLPMDPALE
jgi:hypothetical protein